MKNINLNTEPEAKNVRNASPETDGNVPVYYSGIDWVSILFRLLEKIHWIILAALA